MKDRYGRPIEDLRVTLTHVCNFSCFFCHMEGEGNNGEGLNADEIALVAKIGKEFGITTVKLTGGEPTLRKDIFEIISKLKEVGISEVSMTTNGFILDKIAGKLKEAGLDRVNISLHASSPGLFKEITAVDGFEKVIRGIRECNRVGLKPVKLNFVVTKRNVNEVFNVIELAENLGVDEIHLIELHPVGLGKDSFNYHISLDSIEEILKKKGEFLGTRNKHNRPRYKYGNIKVEVVKPYANPFFCAGCNRVRLTVDGKLKTCLYKEDRTVDILDILRGEYDEEEKIEGLRNAYRLAISIREPNFLFRVEKDEVAQIR
ncbi:GTP 3',8-cyclase MoaA [Stygiolobus caldivivus]|uniref:Probable GTP 3',8-cyclase n=1 Tax=Stygiolobus caldivivus TaxID=2824673 RepID=A0A8D5ZK21_9CREN|nr:GTP 3',8-cyclase MoaA [Stygiolobus caldivivus]BCU70787.1 GTP 3',8-cyclase MoaA [Stygiolobus caldivivus]